jgi:hypothetical protein
MESGNKRTDVFKVPGENGGWTDMESGNKRTDIFKVPGENGDWTDTESGDKRTDVFKVPGEKGMPFSHSQESTFGSVSFLINRLITEALHG